MIYKRLNLFLLIFQAPVPKVIYAGQTVDWAVSPCSFKHFLIFLYFLIPKYEVVLQLVRQLVNKV